jgi:hypothetical protein
MGTFLIGEYQSGMSPLSRPSEAALKPQLCGGVLNPFFRSKWRILEAATPQCLDLGIRLWFVDQIQPI